MNVTAHATGELLILFLAVAIAIIAVAISGMTSHKDEREDKACAVQEGTGHQSPHT